GVEGQRGPPAPRRGSACRAAPPPAPYLGGDGVSRRLGRETAPLRVAPAALIRARRDLERGDDFKILDRHEGGDLLVTRDNEGERRRLDPPQGVDAVGASAAGAERLRPGRVQADEPVGLLAAVRRIAPAPA